MEVFGGGSLWGWRYLEVEAFGMEVFGGGGLLGWGSLGVEVFGNGGLWGWTSPGMEIFGDGGLDPPTCSHPGDNMAAAWDLELLIHVGLS